MSRQQRRALARQQAKAASASAPVAPAPKPGGPQTPGGKAISSQNALSHGLTSAKLVLPWENQADFNELLDGLVREHQPATTTEGILVREIAEQYWRLLRARNQEHAQLSRADEGLSRADQNPEAFLAWDKAVQLTARYATRHERAFHKCLATLRTLQKERRAREAEAQAEAEAEANPETQAEAEREFVSQNEPEPVLTSGHDGMPFAAAIPTLDQRCSAATPSPQF